MTTDIEMCGMLGNEICTKGIYGYHWCIREEEHNGKCKCRCETEYDGKPYEEQE